MTRAIVMMIFVAGCTPSRVTPPPGKPSAAAPKPANLAPPPPPAEEEAELAPAELRLDQLRDDPISFMGHGAFFEALLI
jgi:hypothetical protein